MECYVIRETTAWGDVDSAKTPDEFIRCKEKAELLQNNFPIINNYKLYEFKSLYQAGPTLESQTFIASFADIYDGFIGNKEIEFVEKLTSIGLRFHKEACIFRGNHAYMILVVDTDIELDSVSSVLRAQL